jgi:outer membrane protein OmpA-like peptidoglycan-associated protein
MKKILTLFVLSVILSGQVKAQHLLGIANSNYAGTQGLYLNPSSIADSRLGFYLNLVSADAHATNTYARYNAPYSPWQILTNQVPQQYKSGNSLVFNNSYLTENLNGGRKQGSVGFDVRGISFMVRLNAKNSFALTTRARGAFQVNNVSEEVARLSRTGISDPIWANRINTDNQFSLNGNAFSEVGFTYARVVMDQDKHFLKAGLTVKRLIGWYSGHIINRGATYRIIDNPNDPSKELIQIDRLSASYAYVNTDLYDNYKPTVLDFLTGDKAAGTGWGFDLGATYEYRPDMDPFRYTMDGEEGIDPGKNKYLYRIGFALTDIGGIRYNTSPYVRAYDFTRTNRLIDPNAFNDTDLDKASTAIDQQLNLQASEQRSSFRSGLPSSINLNFDYRLSKKLYANLTWIQGLQGKESVSMRQNSGIAITPRLEMKWLELAFPVSLMNSYQTFAVGASLRLGPLFVGSDNLSGLFYMGNPYGANVYAGLVIPFYKNKPKDKDKDMVSDRKDKCKSVPGLWEFKGCPDTDGDKVQDSEDACPTEPGLPELKGCPEPDADKDGVPDKADACPNEAGLAALNGCPDADGDGVADKDDTCPKEAGLAALQGCPDRDGDGVKDSDDDCPDTKGLPEFKGCPDRDDDGVADKEDKCPDEAGPINNNGCPLPKAKPTEIVLTPAEIKVLKEAFDNLEFELGKAVITAKSLPSLDELGEVLKQRPTYRLVVTGHTDNIGKPAANLKLSRERAKAVTTYLIKRGIPATQLQALGYGSTRPVASNKTAAGRQKNRRVEMKIIR